MKYLLLNDIYFIKSKKNRFLFLYLLLFVFYLIQPISEIVKDRELFEAVLGINFTFQKDVVSLFFWLFGFWYYLFLIYSLFMKDGLLGKENIFLRMSIRKWYGYKVISISFIVIMIKFIFYFIAFLFCRLAVSLDVMLFKIFMTDCLWSLLLGFVFVFLSLVCKKYFVLVFVLGVIFFLGEFFSPSMIEIKSWLDILLLIFVVIVLVLGKIFHYFLEKYFE